MARTVEQINQAITTTLTTEFAAVGITIDATLWSKRNILRLLCYTVAVAQNLLEQLQDIFIDRVTVIQARSAAASVLWLQDKMFKFQYSATTPQIININALNLTDAATGTVYQYLVAAYPTINEDLRIITACSVKANISNQVKIKIAKGNPFAPLSAPELAAAESYVDMIGAAGITYNVISLAPDQITVQANIYYNGTYSAVIATNVEAAINNFFQNASIVNFDGAILLSLLTDAIQNVEGVNDVVLVNVRCRRDADAWAAGTDIVAAQLVISRQWQSIAGYAIAETTATHTLADTLNYIAQ